MKLEIKTIVNIEVETSEALALSSILNGFIDLQINNKDFFDAYSLSDKELSVIKTISKRLNSISTMID